MVKYSYLPFLFLISLSEILYAQEPGIPPSVPINRFVPFVNRVEAGDGRMPNVWGRQNSYLLETEHGIIIFDGLRTVKEAEAVKKCRLDQATWQRLACSARYAYENYK